MPDPDYAASVSFLLSQLGAAVAQRFADQIADSGLSPRGFAVLSNLQQFGSRNQQQLADELGMHRNNMVSVIDELEANGWARRVRSSTDRRAFVIELTVAGRRLTRRTLEVVRGLDRELTAGLTAARRAELGRLLQGLAEQAGLTPGVHPHLSGRR